MKIALTGGTGFIGSHFLKQALAEGHTILAIRRSPTSRPRIHLDQEPIWIDRQLDEVDSKELEGYEVLVHLAAHTGNVPYDSLANCLRWNLIAVLELFEQARQAGIKRFIVAGSCFEYGRSGERYSEIPSDAPLEPTNSYAASKAAATIALRQWAEEHQLTLEILRVFHVFGEGEAEQRFWPSLRHAALSGVDMPMTHGEQIRDFLPVQDVVTTFLDRCNLPRGNPQGISVFNLGTGNPCTLAEFAKTWWQHWGAQGCLLFGEVPYRNGEVMRYIPGPEMLIVGR